MISQFQVVFPTNVLCVHRYLSSYPRILLSNHNLSWCLMCIYIDVEIWVVCYLFVWWCFVYVKLYVLQILNVHFYLGSTDSFNDAIRHLLRFFLVLLLIIIIIISYKCSVYFMRLKNDEFYIFDVCFGSNSEFWIFCDFCIEKKIIVSFEYFVKFLLKKKIIFSFKYFTIRPVWIM